MTAITTSNSINVKARVNWELMAIDPIRSGRMIWGGSRERKRKRTPQKEDA
jgi:hypothetical protein